MNYTLASDYTSATIKEYLEEGDFTQSPSGGPRGNTSGAWVRLTKGIHAGELAFHYNPVPQGNDPSGSVIVSPEEAQRILRGQMMAAGQGAMTRRGLVAGQMQTPSLFQQVATAASIQNPQATVAQQQAQTQLQITAIGTDAEWSGVAPRPNELQEYLEAIWGSSVQNGIPVFAPKFTINSQQQSVMLDYWKLFVPPSFGQNQFVLSRQQGGDIITINPPDRRAQDAGPLEFTLAGDMEELRDQIHKYITGNLSATDESANAFFYKEDPTNPQSPTILTTSGIRALSELGRLFYAFKDRGQIERRETIADATRLQTGIDLQGLAGTVAPRSLGGLNNVDAWIKINIASIIGKETERNERRAAALQVDRSLSPTGEDAKQTTVFSPKTGTAHHQIRELRTSEILAGVDSDTILGAQPVDEFVIFNLCNNQKTISPEQILISKEENTSLIDLKALEAFFLIALHVLPNRFYEKIDNSSGDVRTNLEKAYASFEKDVLEPILKITKTETFPKKDTDGNNAVLQTIQKWFQDNLNNFLTEDSSLKKFLIDFCGTSSTNIQGSAINKIIQSRILRGQMAVFSKSFSDKHFAIKTINDNIFPLSEIQDFFKGAVGEFDEKTILKDILSPSTTIYPFNPDLGIFDIVSGAFKKLTGNSDSNQKIFVKNLPTNLNSDQFIPQIISNNIFSLCFEDGKSIQTSLTPNGDTQIFYTQSTTTAPDSSIADAYSQTILSPDEQTKTKDFLDVIFRTLGKSSQNITEEEEALGINSLLNLAIGTRRQILKNVADALNNGTQVPQLDAALNQMGISEEQKNSLIQSIKKMSAGFNGNKKEVERLLAEIQKIKDKKIGVTEKDLKEQEKYEKEIKKLTEASIEDTFTGVILHSILFNSPTSAQQSLLQHAISMQLPTINIGTDPSRSEKLVELGFIIAQNNQGQSLQLNPKDWILAGAKVPFLNQNELVKAIDIVHKLSNSSDVYSDFIQDIYTNIDSTDTMVASILDKTKEYALSLIDKGSFFRVSVNSTQEFERQYIPQGARDEYSPAQQKSKWRTVADNLQDTITQELIADGKISEDKKFIIDTWTTGRYGRILSYTPGLHVVTYITDSSGNKENIQFASLEHEIRLNMACAKQKESDIKEDPETKNFYKNFYDEAATLFDSLRQIVNNKDQTIGDIPDLENQAINAAKKDFEKKLEEIFDTLQADPTTKFTAAAVSGTYPEWSAIRERFRQQWEASSGGGTIKLEAKGKEFHVESRQDLIDKKKNELQINTAQDTLTKIAKISQFGVLPVKYQYGSADLGETPSIQEKEINVCPEIFDSSQNTGTQSLVLPNSQSSLFSLDEFSSQTRIQSHFALIDSMKKFTQSGDGTNRDIFHLGVYLSPIWQMVESPHITTHLSALGYLAFLNTQQQKPLNPLTNVTGNLSVRLPQNDFEFADAFNILLQKLDSFNKRKGIEHIVPGSVGSFALTSGASGAPSVNMFGGDTSGFGYFLLTGNSERNFHGSPGSPVTNVSSYMSGRYNLGHDVPAMPENYGESIEKFFDSFDGNDKFGGPISIDEALYLLDRVDTLEDFEKSKITQFIYTIKNFNQAVETARTITEWLQRSSEDLLTTHHVDTTSLYDRSLSRILDKEKISNLTGQLSSQNIERLTQILNTLKEANSRRVLGLVKNALFQNANAYHAIFWKHPDVKKLQEFVNRASGAISVILDKTGAVTYRDGSLVGGNSRLFPTALISNDRIIQLLVNQARLHEKFAEPPPASYALTSDLLQSVTFLNEKFKWNGPAEGSGLTFKYLGYEWKSLKAAAFAAFLAHPSNEFSIPDPQRALEYLHQNQNDYGLRFLNIDAQGKISINSIELNQAAPVLNSDEESTQEQFLLDPEKFFAWQVSIAQKRVFPYGNNEAGMSQDFSSRWRGVLHGILYEAIDRDNDAQTALGRIRQSNLTNQINGDLYKSLAQIFTNNETDRRRADSSVPNLVIIPKRAYFAAGDPSRALSDEIRYGCPWNNAFFVHNFAFGDTIASTYSPGMDYDIESLEQNLPEMAFRGYNPAHLFQNDDGQWVGLPRMTGLVLSRKTDSPEIVVQERFSDRQQQLLKFAFASKIQLGNIPIFQFLQSSQANIDNIAEQATKNPATSNYTGDSYQFLANFLEEISQLGDTNILPKINWELSQDDIDSLLGQSFAEQIDAHSKRNSVDYDSDPKLPETILKNADSFGKALIYQGFSKIFFNVTGGRDTTIATILKAIETKNDETRQQDSRAEISTTSQIRPSAIIHELAQSSAVNSSLRENPFFYQGRKIGENYPGLEAQNIALKNNLLASEERIALHSETLDMLRDPNRDLLLFGGVFGKSKKDQHGNIVNQSEEDTIKNSSDIKEKFPLVRQRYVISYGNFQVVVSVGTTQTHLMTGANNALQIDALYDVQLKTNVGGQMITVAKTQYISPMRLRYSSESSRLDGSNAAANAFSSSTKGHFDQTHNRYVAERIDEDIINEELSKTAHLLGVRDLTDYITSMTTLLTTRGAYNSSQPTSNQNVPVIPPQFADTFGYIVTPQDPDLSFSLNKERNFASKLWATELKSRTGSRKNITARIAGARVQIPVIIPPDYQKLRLLATNDLFQILNGLTGATNYAAHYGTPRLQTSSPFILARNADLIYQGVDQQSDNLQFSLLTNPFTAIAPMLLVPSFAQKIQGSSAPAFTDQDIQDIRQSGLDDLQMLFSGRTEPAFVRRNIDLLTDLVHLNIKYNDIMGTSPSQETVEFFQSIFGDKEGALSVQDIQDKLRAVDNYVTSENAKQKLSFNLREAIVQSGVATSSNGPIRNGDHSDLNLILQAFSESNNTEEFKDKLFQTFTNGTFRWQPYPPQKGVNIPEEQITVNNLLSAIKWDEYFAKTQKTVDVSKAVIPAYLQEGWKFAQEETTGLGAIYKGNAGTIIDTTFKADNGDLTTVSDGAAYASRDQDQLAQRILQSGLSGGYTWSIAAGVNDDNPNNIYAVQRANQIGHDALKSLAGIINGSQLRSQIIFTDHSLPSHAIIDPLPVQISPETPGWVIVPNEQGNKKISEALAMVTDMIPSSSPLIDTKTVAQVLTAHVNPSLKKSVQLGTQSDIALIINPSYLRSQGDALDWRAHLLISMQANAAYGPKSLSAQLFDTQYGINGRSVIHVGDFDLVSDLGEFKNLKLMNSEHEIFLREFLKPFIGQTGDLESSHYAIVWSLLHSLAKSIRPDQIGMDSKGNYYQSVNLTHLGTKLRDFYEQQNPENPAYIDGTSRQIKSDAIPSSPAKGFDSDTQARRDSIKNAPFIRQFVKALISSQTVSIPSSMPGRSGNDAFSQMVATAINEQLTKISNGLQKINSNNQISQPLDDDELETALWAMGHFNFDDYAIDNQTVLRVHQNGRPNNNVSQFISYMTNFISQTQFTHHSQISAIVGNDKIQQDIFNKLKLRDEFKILKDSPNDDLFRNIVQAAYMYSAETTRNQEGLRNRFIDVLQQWNQNERLNISDFIIQEAALDLTRIGQLSAVAKLSSNTNNAPFMRRYEHGNAQLRNIFESKKIDLDSVQEKTSTSAEKITPLTATAGLVDHSFSKIWSAVWAGIQRTVIDNRAASPRRVSQLDSQHAFNLANTALSFAKVEDLLAASPDELDSLYLKDLLGVKIGNAALQIPLAYTIPISFFDTRDFDGTAEDYRRNMPGISGSQIDVLKKLQGFATKTVNIPVGDPQNSTAKSWLHYMALHIAEPSAIQQINNLYTMTLPQLFRSHEFNVRDEKLNLIRGLCEHALLNQILTPDKIRQDLSSEDIVKISSIGLFHVMKNILTHADIIAITPLLERNSFVASHFLRKDSDGAELANFFRNINSISSPAQSIGIDILNGAVDLSKKFERGFNFHWLNIATDTGSRPVWKTNNESGALVSFNVIGQAIKQSLLILKKSSENRTMEDTAASIEPAGNIDAETVVRGYIRRALPSGALGYMDQNTDYVSYLNELANKPFGNVLLDYVGGVIDDENNEEYNLPVIDDQYKEKRLDLLNYNSGIRFRGMSTNIGGTQKVIESKDDATAVIQSIFRAHLLRQFDNVENFEINFNIDSNTGGEYAVVTFSDIDPEKFIITPKFLQIITNYNNNNSNNSLNRSYIKNNIFVTNLFKSVLKKSFEKPKINGPLSMSFILSYRRK